MRRALVLSFVGALVLGASSAFAGAITGKVVYDGAMPKLRPLNMQADPNCASKHSGRVENPMVVLGPGKEVANIFVQVKNAPAGRHETPGEPVVIDQKGCLYEPRVAGAMVGQTVKFLNSDGIFHNVHGLPQENREFNIGMPPALKERDQTFNKPEPVFVVKCDIHPWMQSYLAIMTHPYFDVTGPDGTFEISDLPDGTYEVEAWHEKLGTQTTTVTVTGGKSTANFSFQKPKK